MTKKKKSVIPWQVIVTAILALTVIECLAIANGINGTFRTVIVAIIAGLAGYTIPTIKK